MNYYTAVCVRQLLLHPCCAWLSSCQAVVVYWALASLIAFLVVAIIHSFYSWRRRLLGLNTVPVGNLLPVFRRSFLPPGQLYRLVLRTWVGILVWQRVSVWAASARLKMPVSYSSKSEVHTAALFKFKGFGECLTPRRRHYDSSKRRNYLVPDVTLYRRRM
jgi:hypothetical protein